ncbi:hypothetical protein KDH_05450 [Dictyobacter sp. S3.2.2.5]|uniref:RDD domain-containing protein n=1 Tax=Dictyobacter halimunensis TaxID=3026934 RepID=A0ABQ6FHX1_9CHLR|nr:hypothetical protein KDH_05450 [Dictyobacter sp. S3.2.2.5]
MQTDGAVGTKPGPPAIRIRVFFTRVGAAIIDFIILSSLQIWISAIFGVADPAPGNNYSFDGDGFSLTFGGIPFIHPIWLYVIAFIYFFVQETLFGTTIGKLLFGLHVTGMRGERLSWLAALWRNLLRFLDMLPLCYIIGLFSCCLSHGFQRVGDRVAHTLVLPIKGTPIASYPIQTMLKRYVALCVVVLALAGFSLNYMYYYRPPLDIQGWVNTNNAYQFTSSQTVPPCGKVSRQADDIVVNRHIRLLQTKAPTWNGDTVTYPIVYSDTVTCTAHITLNWHGFLHGWSVSTARIDG